MRSLVVAALLLVAGGCLDVDSADGTLTCSAVPGRACPRGFYCAWNDKCYRDGDPAPTPDLAARPVEPFDFSAPAGDDLSTPADMTMSTGDDLSSSD